MNGGDGDGDGGGGGGGGYVGGGGGRNNTAGGGGGGGGGSSYLAPQVYPLSSITARGWPKGATSVLPEIAESAIQNVANGNSGSIAGMNGYVWIVYLGARNPAAMRDNYVF